MVYHWEPWTQYNQGAVVNYQGHLWTTVQAHQSEPNWEPPNVPALFSRLPEEECDDYHQDRKHHGVEEHHRNQKPGEGGERRHEGEHDGQQQQDSHQNQFQKKEEWVKEHKAEVGGGVVGALAIGAGIWAYSKHKSHEAEEAKKLAWQQSNDQSNYQAGAEKRTEHYENNGQRPPVYWVRASNGQLPPDAIVGGHENGSDLYVARSFHKGGVHPGKYNGSARTVTIAYGGNEVLVSEYEILVGNQNAIQWIPMRGTTHVQDWQPVEGGREDDGTFLFVAQAHYSGGVHPGKVVDGREKCHIGYGGGEHLVEEYRVLAYA